MPQFFFSFVQESLDGVFKLLCFELNGLSTDDEWIVLAFYIYIAENGTLFVGYVYVVLVFSTNGFFVRNMVPLIKLVVNIILDFAVNCSVPRFVEFFNFLSLFGVVAV